MKAAYLFLEGEEMKMNEECAGCFRHRDDAESLEGWHFWEMCGSSERARREIGKDGPRHGAWLCPPCYQAQRERRRALAAMPDGRFRHHGRVEQEQMSRELRATLERVVGG